jgi:pyrimidine-nucleoside phosphorylase
VEEINAQVAEIGIVLTGQTVDLAPGDRKLYALRDVTATAESIPPIISSIMSMKLAAGADAIVLGVEVGNGASMKTMERAEVLARGASGNPGRPRHSSGAAWQKSRQMAQAQGGDVR